MKPTKLLFALVLGLVAVPHAEPASAIAGTAPEQVSGSDSLSAQPTEKPAGEKNYDESFNHGSFSIEGGEMYPFGDTQDAVENSFYGGVGFRYSYWPDFDGFVNFQYAYVKVRDVIRDLGVPFPGVHQFTGRLGLDWRWHRIRPLAIGAGFTCNWTRADDESDVKYYSGRGGMLLDNETEFGWFARLNLPCMYFEKFTAGLNVLWEQLWTLPERSNTLTVGVYLERRMW